MRHGAALPDHLRDREPLGCVQRGCQSTALDDSNYCANHRPSLSVDQAALPPLRVQMMLATAATALALWFLPWLTSAIKAHRGPHQVVQTFALHVSCPRRPALGEQLVVLAGDGSAQPECVYVSGRGTYGVTK